MLRVLDLFSGIGGFSLGLERTGGFETAAFCEIEAYPQKVLKKHWPDVPIYNDVRELTAEKLKDDGISVDVICGGFPCQDISTAGKQAGIGEGTRSGLWSEIARLISEIRPRYAIMENVTALLSGDSGRWFSRVLGDLAEVGYDCEWHCIPASELGAHHHRDRVWIIAYPNNDGSPSPKEREGVNERGDSGKTRKGKASESQGLCTAKFNEDLADSDSISGKRFKPSLTYQEEWAQQGKRQAGSCGDGSGWWPPEPGVGRVANGVPNRSHRLKALGNAVVPQIPELIGRAILEVERSKAA